MENLHNLTTHFYATNGKTTTLPKSNATKNFGKNKTKSDIDGAGEQLLSKKHPSMESLISHRSAALSCMKISSDLSCNGINCINKQNETTKENDTKSLNENTPTRQSKKSWVSVKFSKNFLS